MPNIWTHLIFGQSLLNKINEHSLIADPALKKMFNLGCQGPDFLYYHRFLPWQTDKTMNLLGKAMHNNHCGEVIMSLLEAVRGRPSNRFTPDTAFVYTLGFLTHHILDRRLHPYVYSRSGSSKWDQQRLELMMDTVLAKKLIKLSTWQTAVWTEIAVDNGLPDIIVSAYEQIVAHYYPELASDIKREDWNAAVEDMIQVKKLLHDPTGIRRWLTFGKIDPYVYKRILPDVDVMNNERSPWLDPTNNQQYHTDSVWDLWDQAMVDGIRTMRAVIRWLRECERAASEGIDIRRQNLRLAPLREEAARLIGNLSYETGQPCDGNAMLKFADPIWTSGSG